MIQSTEKAAVVQRNYYASGHAGLAPAVQRFLKRSFDPKVNVQAVHRLMPKQFPTRQKALRPTETRPERKIPSTVAELREFLAP